MTEEPMVITVVVKVSNGKGGFKITDSMGEEYILSAKNRDLENQLIVGRATTITPFISTYGKFINKAELFDGKPPEEKQVEPTGVEPSISPKVKEPVISGEERGMWYKEMGSRIGDGSLEKAFPNMVVKIKAAYYQKMSQITGIKFKED